MSFAKQHPDLGQGKINWELAAVSFGVPDGAVQRRDVLDVLMGSPGTGSFRLASLWPYVETDPDYRRELLARLESRHFFEIEAAIHALKGGTELPEVHFVTLPSDAPSDANSK